MQSFRLIYLSISVFALLAVVFDAYAQEGAAPEAQRLAIAASLPAAERQAARLLIYSTILSAELGEVVEIPAEVEARYNTSAKAVGFTLPAGLIGAGTVYLSGRSSEKFRTYFPWINQLIALAGDGYRAALQGLQWSARFLRLNVVVEKSSQVAEGSYNAVLKPVVSLFARAGVGYSVAAATGVSLLSGSSYATFYSSEAALTHESARSLLGYNSALDRRIDEKLVELSAVYGLEAEKVAKFKEAIRSAIVDEAIKNRFRDDAHYEIRLAQILAQRKLISAEEAAAAQALARIVEESTQHDVTPDGLTRLQNSVGVIVSVSAVLESMINSGKLSPSSERQARGLLANAQKTVVRIARNLK